MPPTVQHLANQWHSQQSQSAALPRLDSRALDNISPVVNHFTPQQQYIQRCLAVTSASISILSAITVLYWFIKMRRTFRHHLVVILIVSDLFKSVWYLIFPAVVITQGGVKDASAFCQATGFFVALGIEASDFATLIIAVHAALYIFRSSNAISGAGLYRYRYTAFCCWATFSLITASVAFVNHASPYVSQGTYCYLPVRPFWYRLALAWVPRYLIFGIILGIYVAIYIHVKYKFKGVHVKLRDYDLAPQTSRPSADNDHSPRSGSLLEKQVTPPTPVLAAHGLIGSTEELGTTNNQAIADPTNHFTPTPAPGNSTSGMAANTAAPVWENYTFGASAALPPPLRESPPIERPGLQIDGETGEASNGQPTEMRRRSSPSSVDSRRVLGLVQALRESRRFSSSDPLTDGPAPQSDLQTLPSKRAPPINLIDSNGSNLVTRSLRRRHIAIRRQLRYMFIYPAVYMLMWIIPFLSHCLNYSDRYWRYPMYGINCCVVVIIPLQCAVDCWLFAYREKPWQYIPGSQGTFWNSFAFWTHDRQREAGVMPPAGGVSDQGPGRSLREMSVESRLAYQRREEEIARMRALRVSRDEAMRSQQVLMARMGRGEDRNWWEEEGRRRQDSVWMGTEGCTEPVRLERAATIEEEDEDEERHSAENREQPRIAEV